jgi:hypothetical protein
MKTLFAIILLGTLSFGATAQQATSQQTPAKTATTTTKVADSYRCPICGYTSTKAGDCPKDKVSLVKVGDYYCPDCYMTAKKSGKCTMCGVDMKKMEPATASTTKK